MALSSTVVKNAWTRCTRGREAIESGWRTLAIGPITWYTESRSRGRLCFVVLVVSVDRKPEILELVNPVQRFIVEVDHGILRGTTSKYRDFGFIYRELKAGLRSPRFTDEEHGLELFRRLALPAERYRLRTADLLMRRSPGSLTPPCGSSAKASLSGCIMMMKSRGDSGSPWGTPLPMGTVLP